MIRRNSCYHVAATGINMRRRLEKYNLGFSTCFFDQFELRFVQDIIQDISYLYIRHIRGLKKPKN